VVCLPTGVWAEPLLQTDLEEEPRRQLEPALPSGLTLPDTKSNAEPSLPGGLVTPTSGGGPRLPSGIGGDQFISDSTANDETTNTSLSSLQGFIEARGGRRINNDPLQRDTSLAEGRLQLALDFTGEKITARFTSDLLLDDVVENDSISLDRGQGEIDVREAWLQRPVGQRLDIKLGRQILTWGTGDLVFINDLFPKDWNSFFIGRDTEYLKAPSDAIKFSLYLDAVNIDVAWTPRFDSDRFIDGRRISFFNRLVGGLTGRDAPVEPDFPSDGEQALRLYKTINGIEIAAYGYQGYWKSPNGFNPETGNTIFPRLDVWGASVRGNFAKGIANAEVGYYKSGDDGDGSNPFINNTEFRALLAFEKELAPNLTGAFQYYIERISDYENYRNALIEGQPQRDRIRHLLTTRITRLTHNQNMTWSLFLYYSPSDEDGYARPKLSWKASDAMLIEGGFNLFRGAKQVTFFGQFEDVSNVYAGIRYSF